MINTLKLVVLLLFVLFFGTSSKESDVLKLEPINSELNGIIKSDSLIICYGDNGFIYYSDYNLEKWNKSYISNDINIKKMIYGNKNYYGFSNSNFFKKSFIFLLDEKLKLKTKILFNLEIKDCFLYNNYFYILNKNKIEKYDNNLSNIEDFIDVDSNCIAFSIYNDTMYLINSNAEISTINFNNKKINHLTNYINNNQSKNIKYKHLNDNHYILIDTILYKSTDNCLNFYKICINAHIFSNNIDDYVIFP